VALAATAVATVLSACGGDGEETTKPAAEEQPATRPAQPATVDSAAVEKQLKRNLKGISMPAIPVPVYPPGGGPPEQSQLGGGKIKVRSVTCPEDIPAEKGSAFTCDIDAGKTEATARLTELNNSGTKLRFKATLKSEVAGGVTETTRLRGTINTTR
jgi:hypothetical protein